MVATSMLICVQTKHIKVLKLEHLTCSVH